MVKKPNNKKDKEDKKIDVADDFEFTFKITKEEANILLIALQELPGKICNPLSEKLREQAIEQVEGKTIHHSIEEGIAIEEHMSGG
jgi:hypothetical protein